LHETHLMKICQYSL